MRVGQESACSIGAFRRIGTKKIENGKNMLYSNEESKIERRNTMRKKKRKISLLLAMIFSVQVIGSICMEADIAKASETEVPATQISASTSSEATFYIRVSKEEFPQAPYIYAWVDDASVTGVYPGTKMTSEGNYWSYRSTEFSTANVLLITEDGWSTSTGYITGKATYNKEIGRWSALQETSAAVENPFYVYVSKEEFPEAPYIYVWLDDATVTGIYPGVKMTSEGDYWSYHSTKFSAANVVLSTTDGWSSNTGNITGKAIYNKSIGRWSTFADSNTATAEPTETPAPVITNEPTKEPIETLVPVITSEPTKEPTETPVPVITNEPTEEPTESQAPVQTISPTETPVTTVTSAPEQSCTITFDAMGGLVSTDTMNVTYGKAYGTLPAALKNGYNFVGWYTDPTQGTKVTEDTVVSNTEDHCLYAHWTVQYKSIGLEGLTYSFVNASGAFGYEEEYKIPLEVYQEIYGKTTKAREFYDYSKKWAGNCFGMAATSIMFNVSANDVDVTDYNKKASDLSECLADDIEKDSGITLTKFIEMLHVVQKDGSVQSCIWKNADNLEGLYEAVEASTQQQGYPVIITIYNSTTGSGHAVVGYKLNESKTKLYIYDPNMPHVNRSIALSLNREGKPVSWNYMMNDSEKWGTDSTDDCWISYIPYETFYEVWSNRGSAEESEQNLLRLNTDNAKIYDSEQNLVAEYKNGELQTALDSIYEIMEMDMQQTDSSMHSLYLPTGMYTIENTDNKKKSVTIGMVNVNLGTTITTDAEKVEVAVDDAKNQNDVNVELKDDQKHDVSFYVNGQEVSDVTIKSFANFGGSIEKEGYISVAKGSNRTFKIKPSEGYEIADVLVNGKSVGAVSSYEFKDVQSNSTISASFKKIGESSSSADTSLKVKKGMLVTSGKLQYKVTKVSNTNGTVMLVKSLETTSQTVTVPDKIKIGTKTYKVTAIKDNVFQKHKKLKSVTIGKNVTTIGKKVFYGDSKLKTITIKSKVLKTIGAKTFTGIYKKVVVKIPKSKWNSYKKLLVKKGMPKKSVYKKYS